MATQPKHRIFYLDSMRAVLMLLGIVIHSAQIFSPKNVFPIVNEQTTVGMSYLVDALHLFRMPAFFVVSGFFCYMTIEKYGIRKFFDVRLKRILIPLLTTLFTLNIFQFLLLKHFNVIDVSFERYINSGRYIEHLWFLVDLMYFFIFTAILHGFFNKNLGFRILSSHYIILLLPSIHIAIMSLNKLGVEIYTNYWGIFSPYSILYNYVFFIFGYFLYKNKNLYDSFVNARISFYVFILCICITFGQTESNGLVSVVAHEYTHVLSQWCCIAICFKIFKMLFDNPSNLSRSLSESSYTIYLFHFSILMIFSIYFVKFNFTPIVGFTITIIFVSLASFFVHYKFINNSKILRFLYNGK